MQSISLSVVKTLPVQNELGEGVFWDVASKSIWWTDILSARIYQYQLSQDRLTQFDMPEPVGSFAITDQPNLLLCAFARGLAFYDLLTEKLDWLTKPSMAAGMRFNDGKTDRQGRFWAGTMHAQDPKDDSCGQLYRVCQNTVQPTLSGIHISNGLCWSPDSSLLYHSDSPTRAISQYRFDAQTGEVGSKGHFATLPEGQFPDGATVDTQGNLYVAVWDGGCVRKYSVDGQHLCDYVVPVSKPTCVAFIGDNLDMLAVTTARENMTPEALETEPQAGDMFIYHIGHKGIAEQRYPICRDSLSR